MLSRLFESLESRQLLSAVDPAITLKVVGPTNTLLPSDHPQDLIIDSSRNQLLAFEQSTIQRFDMSNGSLLGLIGAGNSFLGGDITMDGRFLYVGDGAYETVYKVNLSTGAISIIPVAI